MTLQTVAARCVAVVAMVAVSSGGSRAVTLSATYVDNTVNGQVITISDAAKTQIQSALDFYNGTFNGSSVTQTIALIVSDQSGGAQSQ